MSFSLGVTVATLCWWFGNQQNLIFSCFMRIHSCGGYSCMFFVLGNNFILCCRGNILAPCFIVPSFLCTLHYILKWYGSFVYIRIWPNLWFSLFLKFPEKLEITCSLVWKQRNIAFLTSSHISKKLLCEEQCKGLLLLVRLDSGPFQSSRCTPKLKGDFCQYDLSLCVWSTKMYTVLYTTHLLWHVNGFFKALAA